MASNYALFVIGHRQVGVPYTGPQILEETLQKQSLTYGFWAERFVSLNMHQSLIRYSKKRDDSQFRQIGFSAIKDVLIDRNHLTFELMANDRGYKFQVLDKTKFEIWVNALQVIFELRILIEQTEDESSLNISAKKIQPLTLNGRIDLVKKRQRFITKKLVDLDSLKKSLSFSKLQPIKETAETSFVSDVYFAKESARMSRNHVKLHNVAKTVDSDF